MIIKECMLPFKYKFKYTVEGIRGSVEYYKMVEWCKSAYGKATPITDILGSYDKFDHDYKWSHSALAHVLYIRGDKELTLFQLRWSE
jgi:hypothetical protein